MGRVVVGGLQFTLDMETNAAKNSAFVQEHKNWSEKSKQGKAERKCGWCGKEMTHRIPKSEGAPFLGCSGYPSCKYVLNYTKVELREIAEQDRIREETLRKERIENAKPYVDVCIAQNICPICNTVLQHRRIITEL